MMEWIIEIVKALITLAGVYLTVRYSLKTKKLEVDKTKDQALLDCQGKHAANLDKVKGEFNIRLDGIDDKLDEIKMEQLRSSINVTKLQEDIEKFSDATHEISERMSKLENRVTALEVKEKII